MKRFEIFRLFGFPIRVDLSWLLILLLVTYSLAVGFFPVNHPGLATGAYWGMGFVAAIGLFLSILFHEISHALVARHYKIKIDGITLFIFGGVAEMKQESPSPKVEFWVAVVGPVASFVLAFLFFALSRWAQVEALDRAIILIFYYLGFMNALLAMFNLVPAFPLDGGRIFRSILWAVKKDYLWATRIAAWLGQGFGWLLVIFGVVSFFRQNTLGGIWYVLIGLFLRRASQLSLKQVQLQLQVEKIPLENLIEPVEVQLAPRDSLVDALARLQGPTLHTQYPVVEGKRLVGFVRMDQLKDLDSPDWEHRLIEPWVESDLSMVTVQPDQTTWEAFQKMVSQGLSVLFVVQGEGHLVGRITMERLLARLQAGAPQRESGHQ